MKKACSTCKKVQSISEFSLNKNTKDGRQTVCKACCKKRWKAKKYSSRSGIAEEAKELEETRRVNRLLSMFPSFWGNSI